MALTVCRRAVGASLISDPEMRCPVCIAIVAFVLTVLSCATWNAREMESLSAAQACDAMCRPLNGALDFVTQPPTCRCTESR